MYLKDSPPQGASPPALTQAEQDRLAYVLDSFEIEESLITEGMIGR
jgi:hypothetical protein